MRGILQVGHVWFYLSKHYFRRTSGQFDRLKCKDGKNNCRAKSTFLLSRYRDRKLSMKGDNPSTEWNMGHSVIVSFRSENNLSKVSIEEIQGSIGSSSWWITGFRKCESFWKMKNAIFPLRINQFQYQTDTEKSSVENSKSFIDHSRF